MQTVQQEFSNYFMYLLSSETGECLQVLEGHTDEIFSCSFNYEGDIIITGSKDNTCKIWKELNLPVKKK